MTEQTYLSLHFSFYVTKPSKTSTKKDVTGNLQYFSYWSMTLTLPGETKPYITEDFLFYITAQMSPPRPRENLIR